MWRGLAAAVLGIVLMVPLFVPSRWAEVTFGSPPVWLGPIAEWGYHVVIFGIAGLVLGRLRERSLDRALAWREAATLVLVLILAGALIEGIQKLVPQRSASLGDLAANAFGALLGVAVVWAWGKVAAGDSPHEGD